MLDPQRDHEKMAFTTAGTYLVGRAFWLTLAPGDGLSGMALVIGIIGGVTQTDLFWIAILFGVARGNPERT
ncbi:MAG: hypothetical protein H0T12_00035 [Actinobacteria bacterium]|nr:hypothetical protein [Actinomycetota bacterium]